MLGVNTDTPSHSFILGRGGWEGEGKLAKYPHSIHSHQECRINTDTPSHLFILGRGGWEGEGKLAKYPHYIHSHQEYRITSCVSQLQLPK